MCKGKVKVTAEMILEVEDEDATSKEELLGAFKENVDYSSEIADGTFTFEVVEFTEGENDEEVEEVEPE